MPFDRSVDNTERSDNASQSANDRGTKAGVEYVESYGGLQIPVLNWCLDCWDEAAPPERDLPAECPNCGSTEVKRL